MPETKDRTCLRKTVYEDQADADVVARHMKKRPAHSYQCPYCGHYHVGSIERRALKKALPLTQV